MAWENTMRLSSKAALTLGLFLAVTHSSTYAQGADPVPLRNWLAPLSWQATTAQEIAVAHERLAAEGRFAPHLQSPGGLSQLNVLVAITPCRLVDTRVN